ncbi:MAG: hypothetical protein JXB15_17075 [Anaerolineales bacterium]|nr:hypothetical protein [Anaerolineales bacterium]
MRNVVFLLSAVLILVAAAFPALPAQAELPPLSYNQSLHMEAQADADQASLTFNLTAGEKAVTNLVFSPPALTGPQGPQQAYIRFAPNPVAELQPGTTQAVTLTIEGLPEPGSYTGDIQLTYDLEQITGTVETIAFELVVLGEIDPSQVQLFTSSEAAGAAVEILTFRITDEAYTASYTPLFIQQAQGGDQPIPNVTLFGTLQNENNQRISEATFSATITETAVTAAGFTIPAYPGHVLARVKVDNLTRFGEFHGRLGFYYHAQEIHSIPVRVIRKPKPALKISGEQNGALSLETSTAQFQHAFDIYASNITSVDDLQVTVSDFSFPGRAQIPATIEISPPTGVTPPITVGGLTSVTLRISATLPETGTYTSRIALVYGQTRQEVILSVKRLRPAPTVSLLGMERIHAVGQLWPWAPQDVEFWFTLKETGEQPVTLTLPQSFTLLQLVDPKNVQQPVDMTGYTALQFFNENSQPISGTLQLKAGDNRRVKVLVPDLGPAGSYSGALDIGAQDMTSLSQKFSLSLRLSGWTAFGFILLGVAGSWLLTFLGKKALPSLEMQRRAIKLVRGLRALRDELLPEGGTLPDDLRKQALTIFAALEQQLFEGREAADQPTTGATLERLEKKSQLMAQVIGAYQRVAGLKPEGLKKKFLPTLADIQAEMISRGETSAANAESKLKKLTTDIDSALKEPLKARLETMIQGLEGLKSNPVYAGLSERIGALLTRLTQARDSLPTASLEDSQKNFDEMRAEYTKLMAEALAALLEKSPAPVGWDEVPWTAEKDRLLSEALQVMPISEVEKAAEAYAAAFNHYLTALLKGLRQEVAKPVYQNDKVKVELEAARGKVELAEKAAPEALAAAYEEASKAVKALLDKARQEGLLRRELAGAPRFIFSLPGLAALERGHKEAPLSDASLKLEQGSLTLRILAGKIVIGLISLLLATVLGMKFLWADQPTWGSWLDMLTAVLWGFGLNQVTKDSFGGLDSIISKWAADLAPAAPPAPVQKPAPTPTPVPTPTPAPVTPQKPEG